MSLLMSMLAGNGGALPIPRIPCAYCVAELSDPRRDPAQLGDPADEPDEPMQAATIVSGTLVCEPHTRAALDVLDRGHIAASVTNAAALLADALDSHARELRP